MDPALDISGKLAVNPPWMMTQRRSSGRLVAGCTLLSNYTDVDNAVSHIWCRMCNNVQSSVAGVETH